MHVCMCMCVCVEGGWWCDGFCSGYSPLGITFLFCLCIAFIYLIIDIYGGGRLADCAAIGSVFVSQTPLFKS